MIKHPHFIVIFVSRLTLSSNYYYNILAINLIFVASVYHCIYNIIVLSYNNGL